VRTAHTTAADTTTGKETPMTSTQNLTDWALYLAAQGWRVFPLVPGTQRPAMHGHDRCPGTGACQDGHQGWEQRATTDPDRIGRCWQERPFNIGIATGPSGLVVLDLDPAKTPDSPDGTAGLAALAEARGVELPATYTVSTPRGGTHLYFRCPPGVRLRNTASTLAPSVDTRAGGGYVVGPGSLRPDGGYELTDDRESPDLPAWLVQALTERPTQPLSERAESAAINPDAYAAAALAGECDRVRRAPPGRHNAVLSHAAYALGQLAGTGLLPEGTTRAALTTAAGTLIGADCDCTPREVDRVITAGLAAGARNPRRTSPGRSAA